MDVFTACLRGSTRLPANPERIPKGYKRILKDQCQLIAGRGLTPSETRKTIMWPPKGFASHIPVLNREVPFILNIKVS